MRNGKMTIYNVDGIRCLVKLNDDTDLITNACCTGVSWSKSKDKNKVAIEYEPIELEIKDITSKDFYAMLEKLNSNQADEEELEEFDYDEVKNIMFRKLKELSTKKFLTEENYLESCRVMDNIAMTLLETE